MHNETHLETLASGKAPAPRNTHSRIHAHMCSSLLKMSYAKKKTLHCMLEHGQFYVSYISKVTKKRMKGMNELGI